MLGIFEALKIKEFTLVNNYFQCKNNETDDVFFQALITTKKGEAKLSLIIIYKKKQNYLLCCFSSETVSFFLPAALRDDNTLRPLAVDILSLKPCLFLLFRCDG